MSWYYHNGMNEVVEATTPPQEAAAFTSKVSCLQWALGHLKALANLYKQSEMKIRKDLVAELVGDYKEGTHTFDGVKVALKYEYKIIDADKIPQRYQHVIKWKPELSVTAYKQLTSEQQAELSAFISCKWGAPQVSFSKGE